MSERQSLPADLQDRSTRTRIVVTHRVVPAHERLRDETGGQCQRPRTRRGPQETDQGGGDERHPLEGEHLQVPDMVDPEEQEGTEDACPKAA